MIKSLFSLLILTIMLVLAQPANAQFSEGESETSVQSVTNDDNSFMFENAISIFTKVEEFSTTLGAVLVTATYQLVVILFMLYILTIGTRSLLNDENPVTHIAIFISFAVFAAVLITSPLFDDILGYIMGMTTSLSSTIMDTSLDYIGVKRPDTGNPLGDAFKATENLYFQVERISTAYDEKYSQFFSANIILTVQLMIVQFIYALIMAVFFLMYVSLYVSILIFFTFAKPLLLLAVIPWFRPMFKNLGKAVLTFAIGLLFVSIANALTIFSTAEPMQRAVTEIEGAGANAPYSLLVELMIFGVFGAFFHIKASTYAAMITGNQVSDFAQTFATGVGMAVAGTKVAATQAARRGAQGAGQGLQKISDTGMNKGRQFYSKMRPK